jgi:hypothetical protein
MLLRIYHQSDRQLLYMKFLIFVNSHVGVTTKKDDQRRNAIPFLVDSSFILIHTRDYSQILKLHVQRLAVRTEEKS